MPKITAQYLKSLRKRAGLSQPDAASLIGCSYQSIRNWEQGAYLASDKIPEYVAALQAVIKENQDDNAS